MPVIPAIYDGVRGNHAVDTIALTPMFGLPSRGLNNVNTKLNYYKCKSKPSPMQASVIMTNTSGLRGVKPCKGNLDTIRVLRKAPNPYQQALYPHTGIARHQEKGLAFDPQKPTNQPLMPLADSFNAGLNNRLGQPK